MLKIAGFLLILSCALVPRALLSFDEIVASPEGVLVQDETYETEGSVPRYSQFTEDGKFIRNLQLPVDQDDCAQELIGVSDDGNIWLACYQHPEKSSIHSDFTATTIYVFDSKGNRETQLAGAMGLPPWTR